MSDYILRALIAVFFLSILVGGLGSAALWRRMGYFGDAASHAALLGVSISLLFQLPIMIGTLAVVVLMAFYLGTMRGSSQSPDGVLGVIAHGSLAAAILLLSISSAGRGNMEGYLFGSILTLSSRDVLLFALCALLVLALFYWRWQRLIYATINDEMAAAHGIDPRREALIFNVLLAFSVALGIQIVGALLMGAFLIIPAMAARNLAHSPESMALWASVLALIAGFGGFALSYFWDWPSAPSMVVLAVVLFLLTQIQKTVRN